MAFFKKKKEITEDTTAKKKREENGGKVKNQETLNISKLDINRVLRAPRVTEKATASIENGAYVFEVDTRASKTEIAQAVEALYNVKPVKVNTTKIPAKKISTKVRGLFGKKARRKKAYVYLKDGDTIEVI